MDSNTLLYALDLVAGDGLTLTLEEKTVLCTSLVIVKKNYKFNRLLFWGKLLGLNRDYYIVQGRGKDEMQEHRYLYSLNCRDWYLMTPATAAMIQHVLKATSGHFIGDPTYVYEHVEVQKPGEAAEKRVTKVTEENRVAVTVHQIDQEVSVVPRGAFVKSPHGVVQVNRSFRGLSYAEAGKLANFLHFRKQNVRKKKGTRAGRPLNPAVDFMDALSDDVPKGSWQVRFENAKHVSVIRSQLWFGLTFYHIPDTPQHGYVYIGTGARNVDLPFML